jgi:pantoate--beta-alanine ligase
MMPIAVVSTPAEARARCDAARAGGLGVAFVPTMGALHAGHVALVEEAKRRAGFVVVSIFVNALQFGQNEDFARYPRDLAGDLRRLQPAGVDLVLAPEPAAMYAEGDQTRVRVARIAEPLEGERRPGHFEGVATVVAKLFHAVGPSVAVFGRKDYQQLLVVRRMARDLFIPVEVIGHATVREPDGLAMSSRNAYLSTEERSRALAISRGLDAASLAFARGERGARTLEGIARAPIAEAATSIDYVELRDVDDLAELPGDAADRAVLVVACRVGKTRLIDNLVLGEDPHPLSPS